MSTINKLNSRYNVLLRGVSQAALLKENITSLVRIIQVISTRDCHLFNTSAKRENKLLELSASNVSFNDDTLSDQTFQVKASEKRVKKKYQSKNRIERVDLSQPISLLTQNQGKILLSKQHVKAHGFQSA